MAAGCGDASAALADAVPGRRERTQPAMVRWRARPSPSAPAGTSSVITDPAAVYAPSPIVTGATSIVSRADPDLVADDGGCLATPS